MGAALGRLDQAALGVLADGTCLFGDQAAEVGRFPVEAEDGEEAVEGLDVGQVGPLPQGLDLGQALADAATGASQIAGDVAATPRGETVEGGAEGVAGREQHGQLLGHDRKLEGQAPAPCVGRRRHLLFEHEEAEERSAEDEEQSEGRRRPQSDGQQRAGAEAGAAPPQLADPKTGDVVGGVDPLQPGAELLADPEEAGHPLAEGAAERPYHVAEGLHGQDGGATAGAAHAGRAVGAQALEQGRP